MNNKKIVINKEICIGCGNCAFISPTVFAVDHNTEKAEVIGKISESNSDSTEEALASCPVSAIFYE